MKPTIKKYMSLDLMAWKSIERNSHNSIQEHEISLVVARLLLDNAKDAISQLHGKTLEQEEAEIKRNALDSTE